MVDSLTLMIVYVMYKPITRFINKAVAQLISIMINFVFIVNDFKTITQYQSLISLR